jgi:hypothetical protein
MTARPEPEGIDLEVTPEQFFTDVSESMSELARELAEPESIAAFAALGFDPTALRERVEQDAVNAAQLAREAAENDR